ncbi:uncharacterized protein LOC143017775 [Oratosquilla oratoria]|uniref:uncharacterized protein LOC143017775 n=1 Tax=Oratosquilla oratoria TaxID=337810 RepID=UPI003F76FAF5
MAPKFSDEQDEILVEEVSKQPSLWQLSHPTYKDQRVRDTVWAEVADKVGRTVHDCKKRWRNIKDTYDRKKIKIIVSAPPPMKKGKKWALEEKLSFLQSADELRGCFSSVTATKEEFVDDPEQVVIEPLLPDDTSSRHSEQSIPTPSASSIPLPPQTSSQQSSTRTQEATSNISRTNHREKDVANLEMRIAERNEIIKNLLSAEQNLDEIDLFFQSIAKSVKKLPPHLQHRAKVETLTTIGKLEVEMLNSFHPASFQYHPSPTASGSLPASE